MIGQNFLGLSNDVVYSLYDNNSSRKPYTQIRLYTGEMPTLEQVNTLSTKDLIELLKEQQLTKEVNTKVSFISSEKSSYGIRSNGDQAQDLTILREGGPTFAMLSAYKNTASNHIITDLLGVPGSTGSQVVIIETLDKLEKDDKIKLSSFAVVLDESMNLKVGE